MELKDKSEFSEAEGGQVSAIKNGRVLSVEPHPPARRRIEQTEKVEKRGFSRTGKSGDDDQLLTRQIEADVLQIVRARAAHADPAGTGCLRCRLQRNDVRALQWHDGVCLFVPVLPARGVRAAKPANIPLPDVFSHAALSYAVNRADLPCPLLNA